MSILNTVKGRRVFVSWVKHTTRSLSFAQAIGAENYFFNQGAGWSLLKYFPRAWHMLRMLRHRRPEFVWCMNPPYFVALVAWAYCRLYKARFLLDSHSAAFDSAKWTWMSPLHAFLVRRAVCSTVTNDALAAQVQQMGGKAQVVSDIPYQMPEGEYAVSNDAFTLCYICTFAEDEPIQAVLEAARRSPDIVFYITGDSRKASRQLVEAKPDNVIFTGYLTNEEYGGILRAVSAIVVLTTRDFTMQRGGSEAVTVGRPLVISDWPVLRNIFSRGAVYVPNTAEGIAEGLAEVRRNYARYAAEIEELRAMRDARWDEARRALERLLE